jgi:L-seryl-tRNA(Ser) seleniumtransferase
MAARSGRPAFPDAFVPATPCQNAAHVARHRRRAREEMTTTPERRMPTDQPRPPSVERVLGAARPALGPRGQEAVLAEARAVVDEERGRLAAGKRPRDVDALAAHLVRRLDAFAEPAASSPVSVINGTGVILHTNLGRALWPAAAIAAAARAAREPSLLEMDRATGRRGRRARIAEDHLVALTGAGDAIVATNNAAALAVVVGLAGRRGIAVSRGELVEIGGGVRIPEIVRRAGGRLVEVGTTNRTRVADFADPLASGRVGMVLRVHPSNFRMDGFVESPDDAELAALAHAHGAVVVDDIGSGALLDTATFGLAHETTPRESLAACADLVLFSGDKLLGGPQAGIVVGRADLVARMRRDPLARATRPDKTLLAALAATLGLYRAGRAVAEIPVWRAIALPLDELESRAERIVARARIGDQPGLSMVETLATVGGGSLPGETLPSWGVGVDPGAFGSSADRYLAALRAGDPPMIGRVEDGRVVIDMRTIDPASIDDVTRSLAGAIGAVARR